MPYLLFGVGAGLLSGRFQLPKRLETQLDVFRWAGGSRNLAYYVVVSSQDQRVTSRPSIFAARR